MRNGNIMSAGTVSQPLIAGAALMPFKFESKPVRIIADDKGEPWFVAPDVCRVLEMSNVSMALRILDDDEKGLKIVETLGGEQPLNCVSEPGLYKLMARSRKPEAKRFDRWVRHEVLPSIRKTGTYTAPAVDPIVVLNDPAAMRGLLLTYTEKVLTLQAENAVLAPKADALDRIATTDGSMCITDAAKTLQVPPRSLFQLLRSKGWIYTRPGCAEEIGYQNRINAGLLEHKTHTTKNADGVEKTRTQVRVTPKGLSALARAMPSAQLPGLSQTH